MKKDVFIQFLKDEGMYDMLWGAIEHEWIREQMEIRAGWDLVECAFKSSRRKEAEAIWDKTYVKWLEILSKHFEEEYADLLQLQSKIDELAQTTIKFRKMKVVKEQKPYKCPVCEGRGQTIVPTFNYLFYGELATEVPPLVVCRTCNGTGMVICTTETTDNKELSAKTDSEQIKDILVVCGWTVISGKGQRLGSVADIYAEKYEKDFFKYFMIIGDGNCVSNTGYVAHVYAGGLESKIFEGRIKTPDKLELALSLLELDGEDNDHE